MNQIDVIQADITKLQVDAIVNAANTSLSGGGGVDGAIHRAGGPSIMEECRIIGGCPTGEAVITTAGKLPAKKVIHAVGPIWETHSSEESDQLLADCYRNSLGLALNHNLKTIAFPNISTGIYRFPKERAAQIAISAMKSVLKEQKAIQEVLFVCFDQENYAIYTNLLDLKK